MKSFNFSVKVHLVGRDYEYEGQSVTIPAREAHKAYYLFLNPDARTVFENGVAMRGKDIRSIEPDYNATMGWNESHKLTSGDWNFIRGKGVDTMLKDVIEEAKRVAYNPNVKELIKLTLPEARKSILALECDII